MNHHLLEEVNKNIKQYNMSLYQSAATDSIVIQFFMTKEISMRELVLTDKKNHQVLFDKMNILKQEILNSNLFYDTRKDLEEYDKLKNMKFVIDELKKLDLKELMKEEKPKDNYLSENSQINTYLGRK